MFGNLTLLAMAKKSMDWVARRQEVLAENVANADTPGYQARDIKPLDFKAALRQTPAVTATVTNVRHVSTGPLVSNMAAVQERRPYETAIDGNAVNLEEQMQKIGQAKGTYELAANLYQKNIKMLRIAIGRSGG